MLKLYRLLLHLYPTAFREEYAKAMEQEVRDEFPDAQTGFAVVWLWLRLLGDLAFSIPTLHSGARPGEFDSSFVVRSKDGREIMWL
jgi:hypothetical protein